MVRCPGTKKLSVSRNTGTKAHAYPCGSGSCLDNVLAEGIQCDDCATWYHQSCSQLSTVIFKLYCRFSKLQWTCPACKHKLRDLHKLNLVDKCNVQDDGTDLGTKCDRKKNINQTCTLASDHALGDSSIQLEAIDVEMEILNETKKVLPKVKKVEVEGLSNKPQPNETTLLERPLKRRKKKVNNTKSTQKDGALEHLETRKNMPGLKTKSKIAGRLDIIEEALRNHEALIERFQKLSEVATGRNRNVVVHGIPEPIIREGRQRDHAVRFHIINLLRIAELPGHTGMKRVQRLGRWNKDATVSHPRPVLIEFSNPRHRDHFLSVAERIRLITNGGIEIEPDDSGNLPRRKSEPRAPGFNTAILRSPRLVVDKLPKNTVFQNKGTSSERQITPDYSPRSASPGQINIGRSYRDVLVTSKEKSQNETSTPFSRNVELAKPKEQVAAKTTKNIREQKNGVAARS